MQSQAKGRLFTKCRDKLRWLTEPGTCTITAYTYHNNNQIKTLTNPNSEVTTWTYTNIVLVDTGSVTTFPYDGHGLRRNW